MKKKFLLNGAGSVIVVALVCFNFMASSCTKHDTPTIPLNDTIDTATAEVVYRGNFINGPYGRVSGMAAIYTENGRYMLALKNMTISNGPDLHVYVSKEVLPVNFIDLGRLQSVAGNQLYIIAGNADISEYKYALIHCQRFNHLFGSAELK